MTNLSLRPYQKDAIENVIKSFKDKIHKQLLVLPTGSGKTCVFIAIAKYYFRKTLILAHRDELISQAEDKFKKFWPQASVGIYKGQKDTIRHQIIISSVQTCSKSKRLEELKKKGFDLLVIDEAHHASADSYQKIIKELGFVDNPEKLLIGVTATPSRADKKSLGSIFQEITYTISFDTLIKSKYLAPIIARRILTDFKINSIKTSMGDFAIGELAHAVNIPERNNFIFLKWKKYALNRKTLAFCVDVQHCKDLSEEFKKHGISAAAVWGDMDRKLRKQVLHDFSTGAISVLTSCSLLTEGFDEPSIACIIMARPTKSQSLYVQMVGRGLRIDSASSKEDCLVLDFTDKYNNLNTIVSLPDVMPNVKILTEESPKKQIERTEPIGQIIRSDQNIDQTFDILGKPKFIWIYIDGVYSLTDDHNQEIVMYQQDHGYVAKIYLDYKTSRFIVEDPMPYKHCKMLCEKWAQTNLIINYADANSQWTTYNKNVQASQNQIEFLKRHNAYRNPLSKTEASMKIRMIITKSKRDFARKAVEKINLRPAASAGQERFHASRDFQAPG